MTAVGPPFDRFLTTADEVARTRPEVDLDTAREVFAEVAFMLDNGLALDGLDEHDAAAVVDGLCLDLVAPDPGAAVRARAEATLEHPGDLHDPQGASAAYLVSARILQL
jgi:hypothetical protein